MTDPVREREAFEASFPIPGSIKCRDGDTYSVRDGYEESYSAERYLGLWEGWKARAALSEQPAGRCYCDERGIGEPGVTCGDCPRDYGHCVTPSPTPVEQPKPAVLDELLAWAVSRWESEVRHRPLVNKNRRSLDDTWRQVIRFAGGDPDALLGPAHDALLAALQGEPHDQA